MADTSVVNVDPSRSDRIRYDVGRGNWNPGDGDGRPWLPDLATPGSLVRLSPDQVIDVVVLGDGFETRASFEGEVQRWVNEFYLPRVYDRFRGAFRIRALFTASSEPAGTGRDSYYRVKVDGGSDGGVSSGGWENDDGTDNLTFRRRLYDALDEFELNRRLYPITLEVGGDDTVIHNQLARLYSNLVVAMLVRTSGSNNAGGRTRTVPDTRNPVFDPPNPLWRTLNVAFGAHALHEFGHAFAYLEDEYIDGRGSRATRNNPSPRSLFTLSNLSFSDRWGSVPWEHVSPWGRERRQGTSLTPPPVVGWLWRGGEHDRGVWHAEYHCLMNGKHDNYAYAPDETPPTNPDGSLKTIDLRFRNPPEYCLWCQEIVVARVLEKTGQLASSGDPGDIDERGRRWHERWVDRWRARYWEAFDVAAQIRDRERLYANPAADPTTFGELLDTDGVTFRPLWRSPLYKPFTSRDQPSSSPPTTEDDVQWLVLNA